MSPNDFISLVIAGHGVFNVTIDLQEMRHSRSSRRKSSFTIHRAVTIEGADLDGGLQDGRSMFEVNSYAPVDIVDSDDDRCLLASFDFHSVVLQSTWGGVFTLRGTLGAAEAYPQGVYDLIDAGRELGTMPEFQTPSGEVRYLPPAYEPLQHYLGWEASIRLVPRNNI